LKIIIEIIVQANPEFNLIKGWFQQSLLI